MMKSAAFMRRSGIAGYKTRKLKRRVNFHFEAAETDDDSLPAV